MIFRTISALSLVHFRSFFCLCLSFISAPFLPLLGPFSILEYFSDGVRHINLKMRHKQARILPLQRNVGAQWKKKYVRGIFSVDQFTSEYADILCDGRDIKIFLKGVEFLSILDLFYFLSKKLQSKFELKECLDTFSFPEKLR